MSAFVQVPLTPPRTGRYVARLQGDPEIFSNLLGIRFERVRDDLDYLDAAQIRTKSGVYALLGYYLNAPKKGIDIYISETSANPAEDLAEILEAIKRVGAQMLWKDPDI